MNFLILGVIGLLVVTIVAIRFIFFNKSAEAIIEAEKGSADSQSIFVKKYAEVDVMRHADTYVLLGVNFALAISLSAFQIASTPEVVVEQQEQVFEEDFEVEVPPTFREPAPPPPPPPPTIEVVEDEEIIEEQPEFEVEEITIDVPIVAPAPVEKEEIIEEEIFKVVEQMPEFPGGQAALMQFLAKTPYPPFARENDLEGQVFIQFVIGKDGRITDVQIARSSGHKILDDAAMQHVKTMPAWAPGKQRGQAVRVQYVVPIKFKLG